LPTPFFVGSKRQKRIAELSAGLATAAHGDYGDWADLSAPIVAPSDREAAMAEIDSLVAQEFALNDEELRVVFDRGNPLRTSYGGVLEFWEKTID